MMSNRIVVTGMGVVSSVGIGCEPFFQEVTDGTSGIDHISLYDSSAQAVHIAGEIKEYDESHYFERKALRRLGRFSQFAIIAAREAVQQSKLHAEDMDPNRVGTIIGSGIGDFSLIEEQVQQYYNAGPGKMNPFTVPRVVTNMAAANVALEFGFKGVSLGTSSACASGSHALALAALSLNAGLVDVVIAGGAESCLAATSVESYLALRALSRRNSDPTRASRPFDKDRDGFVLSEGAAVLVLESMQHAQARGVQPLAELAGFGMSCDAYHITACPSDGDGAAKAIQQALDIAGLKIDDVDYINAHGTSTPINDPAETAAIKSVFGERAYTIPVSSIKSTIGHALGAAGALEAVATIRTLLDGVIPPTINLDNPDPACDLDYVPHVARQQPVDVALSNSFGFGGQNCVLAFKKID